MKFLQHICTYKKTVFVGIALIFFIGGVGLGWYMHTTPFVSARPFRENSSDYHFVNPLLLSSGNTAEKSPKYNSVKNKLSAYVTKAIANKDASNISVYIRDLNSNDWTGINEDQMYSPASMLKVATLIAFLRIAEGNPAMLDQKINVSLKSADLNIGQYYAPQNPVLSGKTYTARELISAMIIQSDNNAQALLVNLIGDDKLQKVLADLQLPAPTDGATDFMSPVLYSRLFRVLYNATYLSPETSEKTLEFLTQKDFTKGIDAGIPENVLSAQKFGERTVTDQAGNPLYRELHNCGIIYDPNNPYFLCIMTKGQDFIKLQTIISDVSKIVWDNR